jgi:hypothetical protein
MSAAKGNAHPHAELRGGGSGGIREIRGRQVIEDSAQRSVDRDLQDQENTLVHKLCG